MSREQIEQAIPHRPPMLLVDEIVSRTEDTIVTKKTFRPEEFFLQGHYPGQPIVPGVILCEATVQSGAVLLSSLTAGASGVPVLTRMNEVKFRRVVRPGETIEMTVKLNERLGDAYFLTGTAKVDGQTAARLEFACAISQV
jgi:3-hydroxyacyl-[acyl-carrier-protein] dehydratase